MSDYTIVAQKILALPWSEYWRHYKSESLFKSLHDVKEEGQEIIHCGYKRNVREHIAGVVKLGRKKKAKNYDMPDFLSGCHEASQMSLFFSVLMFDSVLMSLSLFFDYITLQGLFLIPNKHVQPRYWLEFCQP